MHCLLPREVWIVHSVSTELDRQPRFPIIDVGWQTTPSASRGGWMIFLVNVTFSKWASHKPCFIKFNASVHEAEDKNRGWEGMSRPVYTATGNKCFQQHDCFPWQKRWLFLGRLVRCSSTHIFNNRYCWPKHIMDGPMNTDFLNHEQRWGRMMLRSIFKDVGSIFSTLVYNKIKTLH